MITQYLGDSNNPRTGNPVLNQPEIHGMTRGVHSHDMLRRSLLHRPADSPGVTDLWTKIGWVGP